MQIDLIKISGLPISFNNETGALSFNQPLPATKPAVRTLDDMRPVLLDPKADGPRELYYMYRDVAMPGDREKLSRAGVRYDITIIKPGAIGGEFSKTAGHYHPVNPRTGMTYPELYEVLYGTAHYLLQRENAEGCVDDVVVVVARQGERVLIPPGYGHITINPGTDYLVMANWVEGTFSSLYGSIVERRGGGYYELANGDWVANPNYDHLPELRHALASEYAPAGYKLGMPAYATLVQNPVLADQLK